MNDRYLARLKGTYSTFSFEIKSYLCSITGLAKSQLFFNKNKTNKLEIGVGYSAKKDGFITSDLSLATDFPYDLRLGLPFPRESIDLIYSEHVLEHFSYKDVVFLLKDCYRVLKNNGVFSLSIPNAKIFLKAYLYSEGDDFKEKYCCYDFDLRYKSKIDYVNYIFYMDGHHRYMFDEENILTIIEDVGFKNVRLRSFDPNLDKEDRRQESIYVEGIK